jgi:hypothetical protein
MGLQRDGDVIEFFCVLRDLHRPGSAVGWLRIDDASRFRFFRRRRTVLLAEMPSWALRQQDTQHDDVMAAITAEASGRLRSRPPWLTGLSSKSPMVAPMPMRPGDPLLAARQAALNSPAAPARDSPPAGAELPAGVGRRNGNRINLPRPHRVKARPGQPHAARLQQRWERFDLGLHIVGNDRCRGVRNPADSPGYRRGHRQRPGQDESDPKQGDARHACPVRGCLKTVMFGRVAWSWS